jgi:molybdenum ABC transporter molybdate-binding protein
MAIRRGGSKVLWEFAGTPHKLLIAAFALAALAASGPSRADEYPPEVVVFCEPTLKRAVGDAAELWRSRSGVPVIIIGAPTRLLLEEMSHRIRSDLVIGEGDDTAAEARQRQLVKPDSEVVLWRNRLVIAARAPVKAGTPRFAGDGKVALVDPDVATAGRDTKLALAASGLWDLLQARVIGTVGTEDAAFLLDNRDADFAVLYRTDLTAHKNFADAGSIGEESYPPIRYWLGETSALVSPEASKFEAFLRGSEAQAVMRRDGLEVLP